MVMRSDFRGGVKAPAEERATHAIVEGNSWPAMAPRARYLFDSMSHPDTWAVMASATTRSAAAPARQATGTTSRFVNGIVVQSRFGRHFAILG